MRNRLAYADAARASAVNLLPPPLEIGEEVATVEIDQLQAETIDSLLKQRGSDMRGLEQVARELQTLVQVEAFLVDDDRERATDNVHASQHHVHAELAALLRFVRHLSKARDSRLQL